MPLPTEEGDRRELVLHQGNSPSSSHPHCHEPPILTINLDTLDDASESTKWLILMRRYSIETFLFLSTPAFLWPLSNFLSLRHYYFLSHILLSFPVAYCVGIIFLDYFVFNEMGDTLLGIKDLLFCMPLLSRTFQFGVRLNCVKYCLKERRKRERNLSKCIC